MATTTGNEGMQKPPEQMKHVDLQKDNITAEQRAHMEKMEKHIQQQARLMKKVGRKNAGVAIGLGLAVVGICILSHACICHMIMFKLTCIMIVRSTSNSTTDCTLLTFPV